MICFSCGHCSQHVACPYCWARTEPNGNTIVGFSLLDIPNPFSYAYDLGKDVGSGITSSGSPSSSGSDSGSAWEAIKSYNPFSMAYDAGKSAGDAGQAAISNIGADVRAPFDAISSFMTVLKWVIIGGAVIGAVVLVYGVLKFVPVALGLASSSAHQTLKMVPDIAAKALR